MNWNNFSKTVYTDPENKGNDALRQKLYKDFVEDVLRSPWYPTESDKHFIIQHTMFEKEYGKWARKSTIQPDPTGYPQYIEGVNVEFSDKHDIEVWSYKGCFAKHHVTKADDKYDDFGCKNENMATYYAYNMFPNFEFRNFTGNLCLRGI